MRDETATYTRELSWILEQICVSLKDMTGPQLNHRPATGSANSAYAIASHVLGVTRVYVLGFGCGHRVTRDRPAEFSAIGDDAGKLIERLDALAAEIRTALAALTPAQLDHRFIPSRELWGTGEIHEISARDALVHAIRHAALHLGELRLTRDLARKEE